MNGDIRIALLGVTGAGKTTFAALASGRSDLKIGYGVDPCTQDPLAISFVLDDRKVVLIDTPGFDDDVRTDVEILEAIAKWMAKRGYMKEKLLDGLIFLHPITLNRVGGAERRRTRLLEKILGEDAYSRVIIATTMWDDLKSDGNLDARLKGRVTAGGVWHEMTSKGATILQHYNNKGSAHNIIRLIIERSDRLGVVEPLLQTELKQYQGRINDTQVGKELRGQLEADIALIRGTLAEHEKSRPPGLQRKDTHRTTKQRDRNRTGRTEDRAKARKESSDEMKEWKKVKRELEERLETREEQLRRLGGLGAWLRRFLAVLLGI